MDLDKRECANEMDKKVQPEQMCEWKSVLTLANVQIGSTLANVCFDLSKCAPLFIEQFGNDSSLQHVQVLLLGPIQDQVEGRYPKRGMLRITIT